MQYNNYNLLDKTSFNAKLVNQGKIKRNVNGLWRDASVSLYHLDVGELSDRRLLDDLVKLWRGKNNIAQIRSYISKASAPQAEIFVLKKSCTNFDAENILGLMATSRFDYRPRMVAIYNISTNPKYAYAQKGTNRQLAHIGRELYHSVKDYIRTTFGKKTYVEYAYEGEKAFLKKIKAKVLYD